MRTMLIRCRRNVQHEPAISSFSHGVNAIASQFPPSWYKKDTSRRSQSFGAPNHDAYPAAQTQHHAPAFPAQLSDRTRWYRSRLAHERWRTGTEHTQPAAATRAALRGQGEERHLLAHGRIAAAP